MTEMESPKYASRKTAESTQKYLELAEIREGTIIMKDGSLRAVIAVSSTNFALKSEEEQNALIAAYQGFLNSLDFPMQVLIHSRILDINSYLEKLKTIASGQTNELLRIQMSEYIEFVAKLVEFANIMSKTFYVTVPYSAEVARATLGSRFLRIFNPAVKVALTEESFEKARLKLEERVNHVVSALGGMGLRSLVLSTEELVELLYQSYNFETASPLQTQALEEIEINK